MSEHIIETEMFGNMPFVPIGGTDKLREEIVRCKDCGCMEQRISFEGSIGWFLCTHFDRPTRRDGFCAWGERRDA